MFLGKLLCGLFLSYLSVGQNYFEYVEDLGQGSLGSGANRVLTLCNGNPCYVYNKNGNFTYAHCGDRNCSPANKTETVIMANACGHNSCPAVICRPGHPPAFTPYYGKYLIMIFSSQLYGRVYYVRCEDEICRNHTNPKVVVPTHVAEVECAFSNYHEIVISTSILGNFGKLLRCDADNDCSTLLNYFTLSPPFSFKKIGLLTHGSRRMDIIEGFLDYQNRLFMLMCDFPIGGLCIPYLIDTGVADVPFAIEERNDVVMIVYFKFENGLFHLKLAICTNPNRMTCDHLETRYMASYTSGVIGDPSITYYDWYVSGHWVGHILISYVADNKLQLLDCDGIYCTESDIQTRPNSASTRRTSGVYSLLLGIGSNSWYVLHGSVHNRLSLYIRTEVPIPTDSPSPKPTRDPTMASSSPTKSPTIPPTKSPTNMPSLFPTIESQSPTLGPTVVPTDTPFKIITVFQNKSEGQSANKSSAVAWSMFGVLFSLHVIYGMYTWCGWSKWKCWQHKCWKKFRCRCFKQVETRYLESEPNVEPNIKG